MEASMDMNVYALEKQVEMRLEEARATSARQALVASLTAERGSRFPILAVLATLRTGRRLLRRAVGGRDASLRVASD